MFIPDPTFSHPGSRIRTVSNPDPGSASKNLSILYILTKKKKWFLSSRKYDPGCSSRIRRLTFYPSRIQGSKRQRIPDPDPQHCRFPVCFACLALFVSTVRPGVANPEWIRIQLGPPVIRIQEGRKAPRM